MEGSSTGLRKGAWTAEEDSLLRQCIDKYGEGKWHLVPSRTGLNRCRKSCRLRWLNYLKPSIKRGRLSSDEVDLLLRLHRLLGNRWSLIAGRLPGRTANDVKNYWNTHLSKKHESCSMIKMKQINITSTPTKVLKQRNITSTPTNVPAQDTNVFKPRPRSFSVNNGYKDHVSGQIQGEVNPPGFGLNNKNLCQNITCSSTTDEKKDQVVNSLTDGDNMWLESFLEESQEEDMLVPEATMTEKDTLAFDVEKLWSLFDGEICQI